MSVKMDFVTRPICKIAFFLFSAVITDLSSSAGDFMSKGPPPALLFGLR